MFKKTLLAAAFTTAALTANAASTITTTYTASAPVAISSQGLPATKAVTLFPVTGANNAARVTALAGFDGTTAGQEFIKVNLNVADQTAVVTSNRLVINITGGFFANPSLVVGAIAAGDINGAGDAETLAINAGESTSTKLVFDLTGTGYVIATADFIRLGNVPLITNGTSIAFSSAFETNTKVAIPTSAAPAKAVATVASQWSVGLNDGAGTPVADLLTSVIDVANGNLTFVGANTAAKTTDTFKFDSATIASGNLAAATGLTLKLLGDFSAVKSVTSVTTADVGGAQTGVSWTINTSKTEATYTYTTATDTTATEALAGNTVVTTNLNTVTADLVALEAGTYTFDADVSYNDAEATPGTLELLAAVSAGGWTLNGENTTVNYVPWGPNTALIVQATSTFDQDASVSVSYLNPTTGKMVALKDIAVAKANSVTRLGPTIAAEIAADSGLTSGKTRMVVTVNAPAANIGLFTGFKDTSDKDRLALPQTAL